jgi:hypothetical protein
MRSSFATFTLSLGMLVMAACGRTELDVLGDDQAEPASGGSGGSSSVVPSGSGVVGGSGATGVAGVGGGGNSNAAGATLTSSASKGGSSVTSGSSVIGGRSITGGTSLRGGTPNTGGTARPGGTIGSGGTTYLAGRIAGTSGTSIVGGRGGSTAVAGRTVGGATAIGGTTGRGGAGGVASTGGSAGSSGVSGNEDLIDDFSDGDRFIVRANGRVGAWKTSNDGTPGGSMFPDPSTPFTPSDTGDPNRKLAAYIKGTGFTTQGASLSFGLGAPYDASMYTGISFWAKSDSGSPYVRMQFPDKDTDLDAGLCTMSGPTANMCYDHYGYRFQITPGWNKYTIAFKSLTQDGWGRKGTAFDPSTLFEIIIQIPANSTFALWIDDIAFTM